MSQAEAASIDRAEGDPVPRSQAERARALVTRRLADIVCLPSSRIVPAERWIVADVLDELLRDADAELRARVAARLADQAEAPVSLLRRLASDSFAVAQPILERSKALTDFDMMEVARRGDVQHRLALAAREHVSETVAAALAATADAPVLEALMRNAGARLAAETTDRLVREAAQSPRLAALLLKRPELRPAQALALFWDVDHQLRSLILQRFAVERTIMREAAEDVFARAAGARGADALLTRALGFMDRRQRDRDALERSDFADLETAVEAAARERLDEPLTDEIAALAGVERSLFERMKEDFGGEGLAVMAKGTGLSRRHLVMLLEACGRARAETLRQAETTYSSLSVDKAQTVLRYWDWSWARARDAG